jgi:hypothetical protein
MNRKKDNDQQKELTRRELLRKAGKLAYTAPTLTVIPLRSNAQPPPPCSDPFNDPNCTQ